jgi:hypothetical protein
MALRPVHHDRFAERRSLDAVGDLSDMATSLRQISSDGETAVRTGRNRCNPACDGSPGSGKIAIIQQHVLEEGSERPFMIADVDFQYP